MKNWIRCRPKWRKVAYGGRQPGYDDNYTDESFLEDMVMNTNVVRRNLVKVMINSVSISQYLCIVALVVSTWTHTLNLGIDETILLKFDVGLLLVGFSILLLTTCPFSLKLLPKYLLNISFFISGLYVLAPVYHTLTRSISSDSIWALDVFLLLVHLFLHNYFGSTIRPPGALNNPKMTSNISLNASIVASVLVASRLPSAAHLCNHAILLAGLPVCTPSYILHQEVLIQTPSAVLLCSDGHDPRCHLQVASDILHPIVVTSCFYLACLPLLAYKDSGIQV